jgi:2-nitrobenzoate nitroreductase
MDVDFGTLPAAARYKLITGSVIPRPIAFVTTLNEDGTVNAAPFSAFNYVSDAPPLVVLGIQPHGTGSDRPGETKDTLRNIERNGEFVINFVDENIVAAMVNCAADFPNGLSEPATENLVTTASSIIHTPRFRDTPIAMECGLWKMIDASPTRKIIIGEIRSMYFRDDLIDPQTWHVAVERYRPVGRLFASHYARLTDLFSIPTPSFASLRSRRAGDDDDAA